MCGVWGEHYVVPTAKFAKLYVGVSPDVVIPEQTLRLVAEYHGEKRFVMKIGVASDLHLEFGDLDLENTESVDVLVLSGDICVAKDLHLHPADKEVPVIQGYRHKAAQVYRQFFQRCSERFPHVIYLIGNHEYYHGEWSRTPRVLREELSRFSNIHFLNKSSVVIDDVHFIGCTLWTNCNHQDPLSLEDIRRRMNDFKMIHIAKDGYRRLLPIDTVHEHMKMQNFIVDELAKQMGRCAVVCTHHAPSFRSIHSRYSQMSMMNDGAYASDLDQLIESYPRIALWTHGHVHHPFDYMIGSTRVVCNPRGYIGYERSSTEPYNLAVVEV